MGKRIAGYTKVSSNPVQAMMHGDSGNDTYCPACFKRIWAGFSKGVTLPPNTRQLLGITTIYTSSKYDVIPTCTTCGKMLDVKPTPTCVRVMRMPLQDRLMLFNSVKAHHGQSAMGGKDSAVTRSKVVNRAYDIIMGNN